MLRYIAGLAIILLVGLPVRAGELDQEFGSKAPAATAVVEKSVTPATAAPAFRLVRADTGKASELDGEAPAQSWRCGRGCGWRCGGWGCGFRGCGFRSCGFGGGGCGGFRGCGFRSCGFGGCGFRGCGFRSCGFRSCGFGGCGFGGFRGCGFGGWDWCG